MNPPIDEQGARDDGTDLATDRILARIGQLTRTLRDSMRELGIDKHVERAAEAVPDARDRLKYIATMTEQDLGPLSDLLPEDVDQSPICP